MRKIIAQSSDLEAMTQLLAEMEDIHVREELDKGLESLAKDVARVELLTLLSGPNDLRNCYFNIQAGTGGADACDWAQMLLRWPR
jgi:peptide chain release factor 2